MHRFRLLVLALTGVALLILSACGGTATPTGSLDIVITGLPGNASADVTVTGPGGYNDTVGSSTTMIGLAVGTYTVTGASVRVPGAIVDTVYDASGGGAVLVTTGTPATSTIPYTTRAGTGKMWVGDDEGGIKGFAASQLASSGSPTADVLLSNASGPNGLAFDADGNLWVSLLYTPALGMYTPAQLASPGTPTPQVVIGSEGTSLRQGYAIAFDGGGNLWVANALDNRLEMFTPAQLATSGSPTPSVVLTTAAATLDNPLGMTFDDAGNLWVTSNYTPAIVKFPPNQLATSGTATASVILTANGASLDRPEGLAFDAGGNLWVVNEGGADTLVKFTPAQLAASGNPVPDVTISDNGGALANPVGLAFDNAGDLWVANSGSSANPVVKFDAADLLTTGAPAAAVTINGFIGMDVPMIVFNPPPAP